MPAGRSPRHGVPCPMGARFRGDTIPGDLAAPNEANYPQISRKSVSEERLNHRVGGEWRVRTRHARLASSPDSWGDARGIPGSAFRTAGRHFPERTRLFL